ncbi:oxalate/formate MFS antiporter [Clostridium coskatii]|uniref:Oxalate:formate antiporter n=1 Tax=Clostridium coskatii TaxID=1705578 RepID=A0A166UKR9_9CLOT|nr:oxalate/formate MFS antiporter [Clostridium coskatii]OAA95010.1 Oxalate:formate antiporter [Clostridium coskatii]OBR94283.1 oxalate:formate antiporter [Clostridium coskatii]
MSDFNKTEFIAKNQNAYGTILGNRWFQLVIGFISMVMIANLQYSWTLFAIPLTKNLKVSLTIVQYAFTIYIIMQTFSQPIAGYLLDSIGSKLMFVLAGVFVGFGWSMMGQTHSIAGLYFFYAVAGAGAGIVYGGSVSIAVRWFPDRRGLCSGLIVAGYGMGSMPFIPIIAKMLAEGNVAVPFMRTGIFQGVILIIAALVLRYPTGQKIPSKKDKKEAISKLDPSQIGFRPTEMLKTPHFWLTWSMFFGINVGGLIITANTTPFGKNMGIAAAYITLAVTMNSFANGTSRFFWGWISDRLGRYKTMTIGFGLNAIFLFILPILGSKSNILYVVCLMCVMFTWGEAFSLFPSVNADMFGTTYSAANYGFLNSAKGTASLLGGGVGVLLASSFGWTAVFSFAAVLSLYASIMSIILPKIPKPTRKQIKDTTPIAP